MHLRVIEFSPYLVVEEYGVNTQPNSEFFVLILCTSLIFLKYESKQTGSVFFYMIKNKEHILKGDEII